MNYTKTTLMPTAGDKLKHHIILNDDNFPQILQMETASAHWVWQFWGLRLVRMIFENMRVWNSPNSQKINNYCFLLVVIRKLVVT